MPPDPILGWLILSIAPEKQIKLHSRRLMSQVTTIEVKLMEKKPITRM